MTLRAPIGKRERQHLELGGIPDLRTERLAQPLRTRGLLRPDYVEEDLGRACLRYDSAVLYSDTIHQGLLDEFVQLSDASDDEIVTFAARRGVLSVRALHEPGVYEEPYRTWQRWARRASATLRVAASLNQDSLADQADWDVLRGWWVEEWERLIDPRGKSSLLVLQSQWLEDVMSQWFVRAELRPFYSQQEREVGFTNVTGFYEGELTTLGVIALQLATAASREKFLAICSHCKLPYSAKRRPAIGRRNYCSRCGINAAWSDAQADKRAGLSKPRKKKPKSGSRKGRAKR